MPTTSSVAVVMGSASDYTIMEQAVVMLQDFSVAVDAQVVSAHRTPNKLYDFASNAHKHHSVIIAGAGGAAHLPGMIASMTPLPVIGVPIKAHISLAGVDSLLSIVQMPKGVPVATVAIDAAANAALLAIRMLAVSAPKLQQKLVDYAQSLKEQVEAQELPNQSL